jgi:ElaB/YqjD/DUF883 family membrane-anchored ribosome-binding protein
MAVIIYDPQAALVMGVPISALSARGNWRAVPQHSRRKQFIMARAKSVVEPTEIDAFVPPVGGEPDAEQDSSFTSKASDKAREYADMGKDKASGALSEIASMVEGVADTIADKLGPQYGDYTRKAASSVSGAAESLKNANVDDMVEGTRKFVRERPVVAIGAAAAVGFLLTRLLRAGSGNRND